MKDTEAVQPFRRNRFFICEYEELAHRGSFVNGQIYYWSEAEDYTASFGELSVLPSEVEAAVLHLFLQPISQRAADPDRQALLQPADAFTATIGRAMDQLNQDGRSEADNDLREYEGLVHLYTALRRERDVEAKSRLAALWKEALVEAHDLTRIENKIFGLT